MLRSHRIIGQSSHQPFQTHSPSTAFATTKKRDIQFLCLNMSLCWLFAWCVCVCVCVCCVCCVPGVDQTNSFYMLSILGMKHFNQVKKTTMSDFPFPKCLWIAEQWACLTELTAGLFSQVSSRSVAISTQGLRGTLGRLLWITHDDPLFLTLECGTTLCLWGVGFRRKTRVIIWCKLIQEAIRWVDGEHETFYNWVKSA